MLKLVNCDIAICAKTLSNCFNSQFNSVVKFLLQCMNSCYTHLLNQKLSCLQNLTKQLKKDSTLYSEKATAQVNEISKENALSSKLCSRSDEVRIIYLYFGKIFNLVFNLLQLFVIRTI